MRITAENHTMELDSSLEAKNVDYTSSLQRTVREARMQCTISSVTHTVRMEPPIRTQMGYLANGLKAHVSLEDSNTKAWRVMSTPSQTLESFP